MSYTTSDSDEIACPLCGASIGDLGDHQWRHDVAEDECPECETQIVLTRTVSVTYRAKEKT